MKLSERPAFSILIQVLLDFSGKHNLIKLKGVVFVNEDNVDGFMKESIDNES